MLLLTSLTPYSLLLTPHSLLLTPYSLLLTPHSSLLTPYSLLLTPHSSLLTPYSSLLTPHSLLLTPYSLLLAPCSLLLAPYSLYSKRQANPWLACLSNIVTQFFLFLLVGQFQFLFCRKICIVKIRVFVPVLLYILFRIFFSTATSSTVSL